MRNLGWNNFDLFTHYIYFEIMIVSAISKNHFNYLYDIIVKAFKQSLEQFLYCGNINFSYSPILNYEDFAYLVNKFV